MALEIPAGVERDARGEAGDEQLSGGGRGVGTAVGLRLVDMDDMTADGDVEPVLNVVGHGHSGHDDTAVGSCASAFPRRSPASSATAFKPGLSTTVTSS